MTNTQVSILHKTFANNSLANIKLLKTQLHKIGQSEGFLVRLLVPLLITGLPLVGYILKPLAKSFSRPLRLTASASVTDAAIHKKMFGFGFATLIISNEKMEDITKIVKSLEESGLLIKGVSETIQNEAKEKKEGFLSMLLDAVDASLLGHLLTGKAALATSQGRGTIRVGAGKIRAGEKF